jgi:hypothetical protein
VTLCVDRSPLLLCAPQQHRDCVFVSILPQARARSKCVSVLSLPVCVCAAEQTLCVQLRNCRGFPAANGVGIVASQNEEPKRSTPGDKWCARLRKRYCRLMKLKEQQLNRAIAPVRAPVRAFRFGCASTDSSGVASHCRALYTAATLARCMARHSRTPSEAVHGRRTRSAARGGRWLHNDAESSAILAAAARI